MNDDMDGQMNNWPNEQFRQGRSRLLDRWRVGGTDASLDRQMDNRWLAEKILTDLKFNFFPYALNMT